MEINQDKVFSPITITLQSKSDAIAFFRIAEEALSVGVKKKMLCESTEMAKRLVKCYRDMVWVIWTQ